MRNLVWLKATCLGGLTLALACGGGDAETKTNTPMTTTSATAATTATTAPTTSVGTPAKPPARGAHQEVARRLRPGLRHARRDEVRCVLRKRRRLRSTGAQGFVEHHKDDVQKNLDALFKGFPDVKQTPTRTFIKGNVVAVEGVMTGTHSGDFMGHPATNKKIGGRFFHMIWFNDDGLIVKEHLYHDRAAMLGHLGHGEPKLHHRNVEAVPTMTLEQVAPGDNALEAKNSEAAKTWLASFEKKDDKAYIAGLADTSRTPTTRAPKTRRARTPRRRHSASSRRRSPISR